MSNDVVIRTGIDEDAQANNYANGTLQGPGNTAYTIATFLDVVGDQATVAKTLRHRLSWLARAARNAGFIITFEVAVGPADELIEGEST